MMSNKFQENQIAIFEDKHVTVKKIFRSTDGSIAYYLVEDQDGNKIKAKDYQLKTILFG